MNKLKAWALFASVFISFVLVLIFHYISGPPSNGNSAQTSLASTQKAPDPGSVEPQGAFQSYVQIAQIPCPDGSKLKSQINLHATGQAYEIRKDCEYVPPHLLEGLGTGGSDNFIIYEGQMYTWVSQAQINSPSTNVTLVCEGNTSPNGLLVFEADGSNGVVSLGNYRPVSVQLKYPYPTHVVGTDSAEDTLDLKDRSLTSAYISLSLHINGEIVGVSTQIRCYKPAGDRESESNVAEE